MDHPLLDKGADETQSNEKLRSALHELNQVLDNLKAQPSTQPFAKATAAVEPLGAFSPRLERTIKTDQRKILKSVIMSQGASSKEFSLLTIGQSGTVLAYDIETGLRYEAIMVGASSNLTVGASPKGNLFACGGLSCSVDVYPINEAIQTELNIPRADYNFNFETATRMLPPEPYLTVNPDTESMPIEALLQKTEMPARNPKQLRVEREIMKVDAQDALRKVTFEPKVVRSQRYVPAGSNAVTSLNASLVGHNGSIQTIQFMDESHLLSGSSDSSIIDWDLNTGRPAHLYKAHEGSLNDMCKVDENTFVSVGSDGYILLWDSRTIQPQLSFESARPGGINAVETISPGMCFATAAQSLMGFFDIRAVNSLFYVQSEGNVELTSMGVSPSGRVVAVGDQNGMCSVMDVLRGQSKGSFRAHNDVVSSIQIYGDTILTSSFDSTTKQWRNQ